MSKTLIDKILFLARDLRSQPLFRLLPKYVRGEVLDVGGWDFFESVKDQVTCTSWTVLEVSSEKFPVVTDDRLRVVVGDGCAMEFEDETYDTVLNLQVLEHVFAPIEMMKEMHRVLKADGMLIALLPQTSMLHGSPHHYYNFAKYWILEAAQRTGFTIVHYQALGGFWSSTASRLIYFFLQALRYPGMYYPGEKRSVFFYLLLPFMALFALCIIPISLIFSLGDLKEDPNNHLVVLKKNPQ